MSNDHRRAASGTGTNKSRRPASEPGAEQSRRSASSWTGERRSAGQAKAVKSNKGKRNGSGIVKLVLLIVLAVVIIVGVILLTNRPKSTVEYSASAFLEDVYEISELSTVSYTYNGVATAYTEPAEGSEMEPMEKYHVAYKGRVTVGVDFQDIEAVQDDQAKTITITIPEPKVLDLDVNIGDAEYIFVNNYYNREDVISEANQVAKADLEAKVDEDREMFDIARENAVSVVKAWSEPILSQFMPDYTLIIK